MMKEDERTGKLKQVKVYIDEAADRGDGTLPAAEEGAADGTSGGPEGADGTVEAKVTFVRKKSNIAMADLGSTTRH